MDYLIVHDVACIVDHSAATLSTNTQPVHGLLIWAPSCFFRSQAVDLSWGWEGPYVSGLRPLVLISDRSSTLDAFPNLLNPSTGPTFICCRSIKLEKNIQNKAPDLFFHLWGIALCFAVAGILKCFVNDKSFEEKASGIFSPTLRDGMTTQLVTILQ